MYVFTQYTMTIYYSVTRISFYVPSPTFSPQFSPLFSISSPFFYLPVPLFPLPPPLLSPYFSLPISPFPNPPYIISPSKPPFSLSLPLSPCFSPSDLLFSQSGI